MSNNDEFENIGFDLPKNQSNVIKVIGVGGGGSNAVNHMFRIGIEGVDFFICNTDAQALQNSPVPNKIQLGVSLTEGLGAGANPEIGEQAALESIEAIETMLGSSTKMVFITAGMGGGTGTGATPIIAEYAKKLDILTVSIVTVPFSFEGKKRCQQAQEGIKKLRSNVDSLIVINNNKLREIYGNLGFNAGFSKADEVLATAARGIAEVITRHYTQNIDLRDVKTVLSNSGTAIMGSATASGSSRAYEAITKALDSPLLNDNKITGAKNVLLLIIYGSQEITIDEIAEINDYIQAEAGNSTNIIMGAGGDDSLEEEIAITIIATGFNIDQQNEIVNLEAKKIIYMLEEEQKTEVEEIPDTDLIPTTNCIKNFNVFCDDIVADNISDDFVIIDSKEVLNDSVDTEEVTFENKKDNQFSLNFDMSSTTNTKVDNEEKEHMVTFDLNEVNDIDVNEEVNDIDVNEHIEVIPVLECNKEGETQYSLDDYMELENRLTGTKSEVEKDEPKIVEDELIFEQKTIYNAENTESTYGTAKEVEIDPVEMPLKELLKERADKPKRKLKDFNYKFQNNTNKIDDIENEPAYKRQGVNLKEGTRNSDVSRTTLSQDSNDDIQLRSNNSFLHDNVD